MAGWIRIVCTLGLAVALAACGGPAGLTDPDSFEGLLGNAQRSMLSGQTEQALELAKRAVEQKPRSLRAQTLIGMIHRLAGQQGSAAEQQALEIQAFRRAVEIAPRSISARANLASSLLRVGDPAAAAQLAKLRELGGDAPWVAALARPDQDAPPTGEDPASGGKSPQEQ
jgi:tetratricopeptide (TPR) repeat protein